MTAILRVKRKCSDIPLDTLVIACKRPRTETSLSDTPTVQTVAQFAGTLTDPTDVTKHVAKILPKINAENQKTGVKRISDNDYPANVSGKIPKWINVDSVTERYKISDCHHSLDTSDTEEFKNQWMTLIDVEDCWSISCLTNQATKEDIKDYVYDLYYTQTCDDAWFESDNILVQRPIYQDVDFEEDDTDSSDSNAESHWRNDYPDTDPDRTSEDDDSDDDLDLYDDLYKKKCGFRYGRRQELDNNSDSDLSDDENNSSDDGERLPNEVKLSDDEEILNNLEISDEKMEVRLMNEVKLSDGEEILDSLEISDEKMENIKKH